MLNSANIRLLLILTLPFLSAACSRTFFPVVCTDSPRPFIHKIKTLDSEVIETSGLADVDGTIWTMNDSGGEAALYALDDKGMVMHKTVVLNTLNADWEDLAVDEDFMYVADVGNNFAGRDTLSVLMIKRDQLFSGGGVSVYGKISFVLAEEVQKNSTGWSSADCEALVAWGDSLFLFTKDWVNYTSAVYSLPKQPGLYVIEPQYRFSPGALITGADIAANENRVVLVGYMNYHPVLCSYNFVTSPAQPVCASPLYLYPLKTGRQVEGICFTGDNKLLISAEGSLFRPSLFRIRF